MTIAVLLAGASALVCAWAWVAVKVDALLLLRAARVSLTDMPLVITSWASPTARHLLARETAAGRVALPAGPGAIQATMAVLALAPAGVVAWVRCGCPVPAPVTAWLRARAVVVVERVPVPVRAVMRRHAPPALPAAEGVRARAALPASTSTARTRPRVDALPAPTRAPSSTAVLPLRFIRPAQPAPRATPPAADPAASIAAKRR